MVATVFEVGAVQLDPRKLEAGSPAGLIPHRPDEVNASRSPFSNATNNAASLRGRVTPLLSHHRPARDSPTGKGHKPRTPPAGSAAPTLEVSLRLSTTGQRPTVRVRPQPQQTPDTADSPDPLPFSPKLSLKRRDRPPRRKLLTRGIPANPYWNRDFIERLVSGGREPCGACDAQVTATELGGEGPGRRGVDAGTQTF